MTTNNTERVATPGTRGSLLVAATGTTCLTPRRAGGVAISPDGKRGLVAGAEGKIVLYELATGKKLKSFASGDDREAMMSVAFSPDGTMALSGSHTEKLRLW